MTNENSVIAFQEQHMQKFKDLAMLEAHVKRVKKQADDVKAELLNLMTEYGVRSIDNDVLKCTVVAPSTTIGVDMKAFQMEEPELFDEISKKFSKETHRKEYLKITIK